MLVIENDDFAFLQNLIEEPYSYVLNVRKHSEQYKPALHKAWCRTLRTTKKTDRLSPFTGQDYKKIIAQDLDELKEWLPRNGQPIDFDTVSVCSVCSPLTDLVPKALPDLSILDEHQDSVDTIVKGLSDEQLADKLSSLNKTARKKRVSSVKYERNPYVRIAVLRRAKGVCELCFNPAPFLAKKDNEPFMEVHHKQPLSLNGNDVVENCKAVCPNCHRKEHYG